MAIMTILIVILIVFLVLVFWLLCRKSQKVRTCLSGIWRKIFWNTIIRSTLETSIEVAIASMVKTYAMNTDTAFEVFSSVFTIYQIALISGLAVGIPIFLHCKRKELKRKQFVAKYGSLTLNMKKRDFAPKLY